MNRVKTLLFFDKLKILKQLYKPYTCIVERHVQPRLTKKDVDPRKFNLKSIHFHYKFVENTTTKKWGEMEVLLTEYIEGIGYKGECVIIPKHLAHYELLPSGLAVYPTKENLNIFKDEIAKLKDKPKISKYAATTRNKINNMILDIPMNVSVNWTLNVDIIRIALRYNNIMARSEDIILPDNYISIKNEDGVYYKDQFTVKIKVNDYTTAELRCKITPVDKRKLLETFSIFNRM